MGKPGIDHMNAKTIHFGIVMISKVIEDKQVKNCIEEFLAMEDLSQHAHVSHATPRLSNM